MRARSLVSAVRRRQFSARGPPPPQVPARVPPPPQRDPWELVETPEGNYYWNTETDDTTAIGESKPEQAQQTAVATQEQQQSGLAEPMQPGGGGMMGMVAQGMAFGAGSSMAHHAIGSMFGGGGGGG